MFFYFSIPYEVSQTDDLPLLKKFVSFEKYSLYMILKGVVLFTISKRSLTYRHVCIPIIISLKVWFEYLVS